MLDLDDLRWGSLQQAYGSAENIPPLLRALELNPFENEPITGVPWYDLWSALDHQGDIYTASYAAVPHIVRIAWSLVLKDDRELPYNFFLLPASINMTRQRCFQYPQIPSSLSHSYFSAMAELHDIAHAIARRPWSSELARCIAGALMVERGELNYAEVLLNWEEAELEIAKQFRNDG